MFLSVSSANFHSPGASSAYHPLLKWVAVCLAGSSKCESKMF